MADRKNCEVCENREESLVKKRDAKRMRKQLINYDHERYAQQKRKEKRLYEKKKQKGTIKKKNIIPIDFQRTTKGKIWREKQGNVTWSSISRYYRCICKMEIMTTEPIYTKHQSKPNT